MWTSHGSHEKNWPFMDRTSTGDRAWTESKVHFSTTSITPRAMVYFTGSPRVTISSYLLRWVGDWPHWWMTRGKCLRLESQDTGGRTLTSIGIDSVETDGETTFRARVLGTIGEKVPCSTLRTPHQNLERGQVGYICCGGHFTVQRECTCT